MASVLPDTPVGAEVQSFAEALNGFAVGMLALESVRHALMPALGAGPSAAAACQVLLDDALQCGRLAPADHAVLTGDLGQGEADDTPTEWSEDVVNEAAPASDTAWPAPVDDPDRSAERSALLYPGAVLRNRFVLQARLKSTGMSEVFKALDRRRQEAAAPEPWVAIKLVTPGTAHYAEAVRFLQQEAALAQRLQHPHIVRVADFDRDGDYAFLTMEWLEGETLGELLTERRHRPLTLAHALKVLREIGAALVFTHERGIVHADVKPGNIFLTRDGTTKLLDFGLARRPASDTDPDTEARTPAYASCEILEGRSPTAQDDVYALACVAYRMLAGRRVFGHHDALAAERAGRRPAPIRTLDARQWAALEHALAFRRERRTGDMATFLREFAALLPAVGRPAAQPPVEAPRPSPTAAAPDAGRRRTRPVARVAGLVALAALAAVASGWYWSAHESPSASTPATASAERPLARADGEQAVASAREPPVAAPIAAPTVPAPAPAATPAAASRPGANPVPAPPGRLAPPVMTPATHEAPPPSAVTMPRAPAELPATPGSDAVTMPPEAVAPAVPAAMQTMPVASITPQPPAAMLAAQATQAAPQEVAAPPEIRDAEPTDGAPREIPLRDLQLRTYVEPKLNRSRLNPDGWVEVAFTVDASGRPHDIVVVSASPPGFYEDNALAAVARWRFAPPQENGVPVARRTAVRLRFQAE